VIQLRLNIVADCWSRMMTRPATLLVVNEWCRSVGQPTVSLRTIGLDRRRVQMRSYEQQHHLKIRECSDGQYTFG
jgi:hypothetical protein